MRLAAKLYLLYSPTAYPWRLIPGISEAYRTLYGKVVTFPGVKWPERESDHSPPSSAKVKTVWNCTSTPPYALIPRTGTIIISNGLWKEVIVS